MSDNLLFQGTLDSAVDRRARDAEEFGDLVRSVGAGSVQLHEVLLLRVGR